MNQLTFCPDTHLIKEANQVSSPNFDLRPKGTEINLLVIHCISLPPNEYGKGNIHKFFLNQLDTDEHPYYQKIKDMKVSSHLLIERDGKITQFVPFDKRAWHAGESCYEDVQACNNYSIGIELEGNEQENYTSQQYIALIECTKVLMKHYPQITPSRIVGHSEIAPARKTDPGLSFDWDHYRKHLRSA